MSVMFMPAERRAAAAKPKIQERRFRVQLRCAECTCEDAVVVRMADEPGDPATVHDFVESGALDRIEHFCPVCGDEMTVVVQIDYMRTPEEGRSAE